ncbi:uncharacterized protein METZ01_LOCUS84769 [marine metagenome]|uniref:Uncharacterized protein n=1 Tax=marine metagenome TaxID=408172 RepID=A0A381UUU9_9ZZZZ
MAISDCGKTIRLKEVDFAIADPQNGVN